MTENSETKVLYNYNKLVTLSNKKFANENPEG